MRSCSRCVHVITNTSINADLPTQLLQEIDAKATFSQQQLVLVRQQLTSQARKKRMLELSTAEIDALPKDTHVYNGVGKM